MKAMHIAGNRIPLLLLFLCVGCGRTQMSADQIRGGESAHLLALEAWQSKDYAKALEHFTEAVESEGLNADLIAEALLRMAECHVELGNLDEASDVLANLEEQAPDMDQFHLVRCKLYAKQGDGPKARAEFEAARAINPALEPPTRLN